jgi:hypothetical protein
MDDTDGRGISVNGLAAQVRHATGQGRELVAFHLDVLHGKPIPRPGRQPLKPNIDQSLEAARWLADRGWGKSGSSPKSVERLSG